MGEKEILLVLAQKVKEQRIKNGVTQEQFYNDTGIHIARIEQGKRNLSFTTLIRIADYFDCSLDYFR